MPGLIERADGSRRFYISLGNMIIRSDYQICSVKKGLLVNLPVGLTTELLINHGQRFTLSGGRIAIGIAIKP